MIGLNTIIARSKKTPTDRHHICNMLQSRDNTYNTRHAGTRQATHSTCTCASLQSSQHPPRGWCARRIQHRAVLLLTVSGRSAQHTEQQPTTHTCATTSTRARRRHRCAWHEYCILAMSCHVTCLLLLLCLFVVFVCSSRRACLRAYHSRSYRVCARCDLLCAAAHRVAVLAIRMVHRTQTRWRYGTTAQRNP